MRLHFVILFCLLIPFVGMAQSSNDWQLYLNQTKLLSATTTDVETVRLHQSDTGMLTIVFAKLDTGFHRSVIVMNNQRNTLLKQEMKQSCNTTTIAIAKLLSTTKQQPFTIYITDIPNDPTIAATMRIAPVPICNVQWKD